MSPRFIFLNMVLAFGLAAAYWKGYLQLVYVGDHAFIAIAISVTAVAGLISIALSKWPLAEFITKNVTKFALLGTVIGFIVALQGVVGFKADDSSTVGPMMQSVFRGMGISLYATLLGLGSNLWLSFNLLLLKDKNGA